VMGDHGPRGQCDDRNPGLWMIVGRDVLRHHPKLRRSLRANHKSMFSMRDMHETLRTLGGLHSTSRPKASGSTSVPAARRTARNDLCRRGPCDIGSTVLPWNRTCTDALVHPVFCGCQGLWRNEVVKPEPGFTAKLALSAVQHWMNTIVHPFRSKCVFPLKGKEVLHVRSKKISASDFSIYQGDRPSLLSYRQEIQVLDMQFKMEPEPMEYRVQVLVLQEDLVHKLNKSLTCQARFEMEGYPEICLFQVGAVHRYARFEACTPAGMTADLCHCRS